MTTLFHFRFKLSALISALIVLSFFNSEKLQAQQLRPLELSTKDTINRIIIKGNVELEISQSKQTRMYYADDNSGYARVKLCDRKLEISNFEPTRCRLVVYVNDIYRIEADGGAVVKTRGPLEGKYLQVILKDRANADIQTACESLYTKIADSARLSLTGTTYMHHLCRGAKTVLTLTDFAARKTDIISDEKETSDLQNAMGK